MTAAPHPSRAGAADAGWSRRPWLLALLESGPALLGVGVFLWWTAARGGFAVTRLYPGALVILAALAVLVISRPGHLAALPRLLRAALVLGGAFALLALLTTLWADAPGDAWSGANRTIVYVAAFALFALTPMRPGSLALVLGVWAFGVAAVIVAALAGAALGDGLDQVFHDRRLAHPIGYVNATCALALMAFWPAVVLASRRQLPIVARALLLGASFVLLDLALLTQSRASALALPLTALVAFALVPGRARLLLAIVLPVVAAVLTLRPMLDVFGADSAERAAAVDRALLAIAIGFVTVALAGAVLASVDRRLEISRSSSRRIELALAVVAVLVAVGAGAALAVTTDPGERTRDAWNEFASGDRPRTFEESRFRTGGLGDYRSDYWRVALTQFREQPVLGVGMDNFAAAYVRERTVDNEARFPHSTPLAVLSSTGLVGSLLLLGLVGCAAASYLRARRLDGLGAAAGAGAILVFVYWLAHGAVDWFWEIPALGAPAFAFLGAAAALHARRPEHEGAPAEADGPPPERRSAGRGAGATALLLVLAAAAAAAVLTPPWLAARETAAATSAWRETPDASLDRLERASRLNPLSERPDLIAGAIANRTGRHERARTALLRAVDRNPVNWYARFELAVAESELGRPGDAREELQRARALNPYEDVIEHAEESLAGGDSIPLDEIDSVFRERLETRTR